MQLISARSRVVFPASVAPAIMMFARASTAACRNAAVCSSTVPSRTRSGRNICGNRLRRIDTTGRSVADITADSRDPSGSRRSSSGLAGVNGRAFMPAYAARVCTISIRSSSVAATGRPADLAAVVGVGDPHLVAAVDVDVLHLVVVQQLLQLPGPVHGGVHRHDQPPVVPGVRRQLPAGADQLLRVPRHRVR